MMSVASLKESFLIVIFEAGDVPACPLQKDGSPILHCQEQVQVGKCFF